MYGILIAAYSFVAAVIGAGFATGQEILCYFNRFGRFGFIGVMIACTAFSLFAYAVLGVCVRYRVTDYATFCDRVLGRRVSKVIKPCICLFSFSSYAVMLSAMGIMTEEATGISARYAALGCAIICTVLFLRGTDKIFLLNGFIGIVLAMGLIICCMYMLRYREFHAVSQEVRASTSALIYSGYNLAAAAPVLASLSGRLKKRSDAAASALLAGVIMFIIMGLSFALLATYADKINLGEMPLLTLARRQSTGFGAIYFVMLLVAVITTLLSSGGSLAESLGISKKPMRLFAVSMAAYAASGFGFSRLVDSLYRICGILGIIMAVTIIYFCFKIKN